jgi:hypothetical protein
MKRMSHSWFPLFAAAALVVSSLPAHAGVSIDRASASIAVCPTNPSHVFRPAGPNNGCDVGGAPVIDTAAGAYGIPAGDDVDGLATNEAGPANVNYRLMFSGDMISQGAPLSVYNAEFVRNQSAADIYRTNNFTTLSPRFVVGGCVGPALVGGPFPVVASNQGQFNLIPSVNAGVMSVLNPDDVDGFERDFLDTTGDQANDVPFYFSVDPASGLAAPADVLLARVGLGPVIWAPAAMLGLGAGDDVDALVVWDRAVVGNPNPGPDLVLFSLGRGSVALAGPDGLLGTADDFSPADIFVSDLTGVFCLYTRYNQIGLLFADNLDALDVMP